MKKRILVLLSVVALMVVMLATSVAPAFAAATFRCHVANDPANFINVPANAKQDAKAVGYTECHRLR